ncbi:LacI family transcriptional regulator [Bacilli bacterium]|uniref:LacI family transcriptional regulator n=1 Tax=Oceanobacillus caeni TaxID=405946 RepID=A0ABR5MH71_9BACI|nr:LacI family DNA-binding transcriptional regulator [Oceanobacillus caeni]KKE77866.1 LacI family transcriptional regulator [Bacilli bacterium VT-13-104]PZD85581.1 LacI family transcriptional regulator [Bacilli bacterium]KPH72640.1 LacI family transcriptional regulator [Oceanobacillus caeni]PZD87196.1 LacI family transcriptional regulator [Bacilli bacterium]PZD90590.1 LacI family transcriptional regulator [Bacilli bacterium]
MGVTIKDVAKEAGVSSSTVSRVISDSPMISERTKRKVRQIMDDMGFHINENARNLVRQSTNTIGIVMKSSASESLHDPFFPEVLRGISSWCHKQDFSISLTTGESEEAIFQDVVKMVRGKKVDGIIVSYSKQDDKVVPYLMECGIPFVVIGKPLDGMSEITYIDNDNVKAAREASEYLIERGHDKIGYIGMSLEFEMAKYRLQGFKEAVLLNQVDISDEYIKNPASPDLIRNAVNELMDLDMPPTGIVIIDDLSALNALTILREKDIKVPDDVSVISFNNTVIANFSNPKLTSIDTQIFQLGYESARCLIEEIKDPSLFKKSIIIPTNIVERESALSLTNKDLGHIPNTDVEKNVEV